MRRASPGVCTAILPVEEVKMQVNVARVPADAQHFETSELVVPDAIDFPVRFEPSKVAKKKYVINGDTENYIDVVGHTFTCASHGDFARGVYGEIIKELDEADLVGMTARWHLARHGGWACMDLSLPAVKFTVESLLHKADVHYRIISPHGIDGSCSNTVLYGAIDSYCTNGQIIGEYDTVRRKNSSNFLLENFLDDLERSKNDFVGHGKKLQRWAETSLPIAEAMKVIEAVIPGERKADKMVTLFKEEAETRGANVYALYSAFTNYSSHANDNGFALRETKSDTAAVTMMNREMEVSRWTSSVPFLQLAA
jgi:hypothetical protein